MLSSRWTKPGRAQPGPFLFNSNWYLRAVGKIRKCEHPEAWWCCSSFMVGFHLSQLMVTTIIGSPNASLTRFLASPRLRYRCCTRLCRGLARPCPLSIPPQPQSQTSPWQTHQEKQMRWKKSSRLYSENAKSWWYMADPWSCPAGGSSWINPNQLRAAEPADYPFFDNIESR